MLPVNEPAEEAKCEDLEKVVIGDDLKRFFQIGAQLPPQEKEELVEFLRRNVDVSHGTLMRPQGGSELHLSSLKC